MSSFDNNKKIFQKKLLANKIVRTIMIPSNNFDCIKEDNINSYNYTDIY